MKILMVYPETPATFWSFHSALKFVSKQSSEPPLGLLTVAAMLPLDWQKKLVDMNVSHLENKDIIWADFVFISGMNIHRSSFKKVVRRCNELGTKVIAGGPMVTTTPDDFLGIDHYILNEAELTLPKFLCDLEAGQPKEKYSTNEFPDMSLTPSPDWSLLEMDKYASMSIQYSRGCPYNCDFCSITMLNGHRPRCKSAAQFLNELDGLYVAGWRGHVFIVDDNFIGNKNKLKKELLPALISWQKEPNHPFHFGTEVSINLADDDELLSLMVRAGFESAFIGIETPESDSLAECGKKQNLKRNLLSSVKKLQRAGICVSGGFIVGFDSDPLDIFERQIDFIRNSGIVTAMVGLLNAPTGTKLFRRMRAENRLLETMSGDNMDGSINFIPKMNYQKLVAGYKQILETIYSHREYYERVKIFLQEYQPKIQRSAKISIGELKALFRSIWILGIRNEGKRYYWKLFFLSLFKYPAKFSTAITMAVYGFHFREVVKAM